SHSDQDDLQIRPQGPRPEVVHIQRQLGRQNLVAIVTFWVILAAQNLFFISINEAGKIGYPGPDLKNGLPGWILKIDKRRNFRPRAHQTHVAFQDVPELWQFVEFKAPQKSA